MDTREELEAAGVRIVPALEEPELTNKQIVELARVQLAALRSTVKQMQLRRLNITMVDAVGGKIPMGLPVAISVTEDL